MSSTTMMYREEDRARLEIALGIPVGEKLFAVAVSRGLVTDGPVAYERHAVVFVKAASDEEAFGKLNKENFDDFHRGFFRCLAAADVVESVS